VSAYLLLFAGLLLAGGRLADVYGRRRLFNVGLTIFTVASLAAGLSGQMDLLVASRAVQGLGAALLTPTTLAIITTSFPDPKERAGAVGAWSAVGALGLAAGPLLGGILSEDANWHWIFFINVPVGIVTLALGSRAIPAGGPGVGRRIDRGGILASTLSLTALIYAFIQGPQTGWSSPAIIGALSLSAVAAAAFVVIEQRVADPMVDLSIFADRIFTGGTAALMMWAFGLFGIYFFTSLYLQNVLGFSPVRAGLTFLPMAVLMAGAAAVSDRVAARVGAHRSVGLGMALMSGGIVSISFLGAHATFLDLMPGMAVIGIGGGLTIPLTSTILGALPEARAGVASALFNRKLRPPGLIRWPETPAQDGFVPPCGLTECSHEYQRC
jgi:EmrB/QacA subfamily drug resistance transporter